MSPEAPFSPETLLSSLKALENPSVEDPTLKARVHSRLTISLLGLAPVISTACPPPLGGDLTTTVGHITTANGIAVHSAKSVVLAWLTPVFLAGAVGGVFADRWYQRSHTPTVNVLRSPLQQVVTVPTPNATSVGVNLVENTPIEHPHTVVAPQPTYSATILSAPVSTLTAERELLDAARATLARGEPQTGIVFLEKHAKQFPKGMLTEEREALYVRILVTSGAHESALARAENFRLKFPNSIFMPVIERAIASISRRNAVGESKL